MAGGHGFRGRIERLWPRRDKEICQFCILKLTRDLKIKSLLDKILPELRLTWDRRGKTTIFSMAENPGQLGILCLTWESFKSLSDNRDVLFEQFITILLQLAVKRNEDDTPLYHIINSCKDVLLKMGKLAILGTNGRTLFSKNEVKETVGENAMKWGLLHCSHPASTWMEYNVSFLHKTIQEWLAAFYIAHTDDAWKNVTYANVYQMVNDSSFQRFLLHMNHEIMIKILQQNIKTIVHQITTTQDPNMPRWCLEPDTTLQQLLPWIKRNDLPFSVLDILKDSEHIKQVGKKWHILYLYLRSKPQV